MLKKSEPTFLQSNLFFIFFLVGLSFSNLKSWSQIPSPVLVGYFHNWQDANAPYIQLDQVDIRYKLIDVSFAIPQGGTDYKMQFIPDQVSQATFITQIQTLQNQGRKVLISVGGATAPVTLNTTFERDTFVSTMTDIINTFGFDGIDIDLEGSSLSITGGTISNPTDQPIIYLIQAIKQIMANYQTLNNQKMILTMAPETAFVQGGQSAFSGIWGAYLPVIDGLRDSLDILHVQLYNSGSMYGIDNNIYVQGTADFIVAMCEAVIHGFNTAGGNFVGLPASKIAAGLPACLSAAGGGYIHPDTVKAAINYLRGVGPQPGSYVLSNVGGYPTFRGLMTWSINWDAVSTCSNSYAFANNYTAIFGSPTFVSNLESNHSSFKFYPNPSETLLYVHFNDESINNTQLNIFNAFGQLVSKQNVTSNQLKIDISHLSKGVYFIKANNTSARFLRN